MPTTHSELDLELLDQLRLRLHWLSYLAFAIVVDRTLSFHGFANIRHSGRLSLKGRTRHGGVDLQATTETALGLTPVLIQLKRTQIPVARHFVDELRAAMLRHSAPQGLIVTNHHFSQAAIKAAEAYTGRPIRLIDGSELAAMMLKAGVAISQGRSLITGEREMRVNEAALVRLELSCRSYRAANRKKGARHA